MIFQNIAVLFEDSGCLERLELSFEILAHVLQILLLIELLQANHVQLHDLTSSLTAVPLFTQSRSRR